MKQNDKVNKTHLDHAALLPRALTVQLPDYPAPHRQKRRIRQYIWLKKNPFLLTLMLLPAASMPTLTWLACCRVAPEPLRGAECPSSLTFRDATHQEQRQKRQHGNQDQALAAKASHFHSTQQLCSSECSAAACLSWQPCRTSTCL